MIVGSPIVESPSCFCTWHGIMETNVYYDVLSGCYGVAQNGIVVAVSESLTAISKIYVEITWGKREQAAS